MNMGTFVIWSGILSIGVATNQLAHEEPHQSSAPNKKSAAAFEKTEKFERLNDCVKAPDMMGLGESRLPYIKLDERYNARTHVVFEEALDSRGQADARLIELAMDTVCKPYAKGLATRQEASLFLKELGIGPLGGRRLFAKKDEAQVVSPLPRHLLKGQSAPLQKPKA